MALSVGSLLAGRYEITAPIATGGMGEVWRARDRASDRIVAAKVLKSEYMSDPSFLARFRNEARHTAALTHQNIASVYDYGETVDDSGTQQLAFLVMEFVEGHPLVTILHDEHRPAGRLDAARAEPVGGRAVRRPQGGCRAPRHQAGQPRSAGRRREADRLRHRPGPTPRRSPGTGMVVGTAQYLSPEQAQGMEVTAASDVYSSGWWPTSASPASVPSTAPRRWPSPSAHQSAAAAAAGRRPARRPPAGGARPGQGRGRPLPRRCRVRRARPSDASPPVARWPPCPGRPRRRP